jgi:DNA-binding MarR family transcriptional regulator
MLMAAFQHTREQTEQKVMAQLLSKIEQDPLFTQRGLAADLDIALGLMNQYLKRCLNKGWVRVSQISARRLSYFLTPEGFKEKSRMVSAYLTNSFMFFKDAKLQCEASFEYCKQQHWHNIALLGIGDLADIAKLIGQSFGFSVITILIDNIVTDSTVKANGVEVELSRFDAVLITDLTNPQQNYDLIKQYIESERLLTIDLLQISRSS